MKCPYAKPSFVGVKCLLINKVVDAKRHHCLDGAFETCEIYQSKVSQEAPRVNCSDCVFFSKMTNKCIKLKVKVEDPNEPPCGGKEFRRRSPQT